MTLDQFVIRFPELKNVHDTTITAYLAAATAELSAEVFGTLHAEAVGYLAAHKIALSPAGVHARLVTKDGQSTTYHTHYKALLRKACSGYRYI